MENNEVLIKKYSKNKSDFFDLTTNYQYIFEVTKCCGYGEWTTVYKDAPLSRLYENIYLQFGGLKPDKLFVVSESGERLDILCDGECSVRKLISDNSLFFRPIYPLPYCAVYRVYCDGCDCSKDESV